MKKIIFVFILLFLIPGSLNARVQLTAFKDPLAPSKPYSSVLVYFAGSLSERSRVESKAVKMLSRRSDSKFISASFILPPVREYSKEEALDVLNKYHIDAVLVAGLTNSEIKAVPFLAPETTYHSGSVNNQAFQARSWAYRTNTILRNYWTNKMVLLDLNTKKNVWAAESHASAGRLTKNWTENAIISKVAKKLLQADLIEERKK